MREFDIVLRSLRQVQDFVAIAMVQPFDVLVGNDRQHINGKDLMGMFSLDYTAPIHVRVICTQEEFSSFYAFAATNPEFSATLDTYLAHLNGETTDLGLAPVTNASTGKAWYDQMKAAADAAGYATYEATLADGQGFVDQVGFLSTQTLSRLVSAAVQSVSPAKQRVSVADRQPHLSRFARHVTNISKKPEYTFLSALTEASFTIIILPSLLLWEPIL